MPPALVAKTNQQTKEGKKVLANNMSLFAQLYVAMHSRDRDLNEFFSQEFQAFPPSLSDLGNLYLPGRKWAVRVSPPKNG